MEKRDYYITKDGGKVWEGKAFDEAEAYLYYARGRGYPSFTEWLEQASDPLWLEQASDSVEIERARYEIHRF